MIIATFQRQLLVSSTVKVFIFARTLFCEFLFLGLFRICILCKTTLSVQKSVRFYLLLSISIYYQTFTHDTKHMALPSVVYNSFILSTRLQQGNKIKGVLSHLAFLKVHRNCVLHFQKELKTI